MRAAPLPPVQDPIPPCPDLLWFKRQGVILRLVGRTTMRRRDFITLLGGAAAGWPIAVRAQQPAMPVVGWLSGRTAETDTPLLPAFRRGLGQHGFTEGRNLTVEYRY